MFATHRPTITLRLHNFDLFRTFNWHDASCGPSAIAVLLVFFQTLLFRTNLCSAWSLGCQHNTARICVGACYRSIPSARGVLSNKPAGSRCCCRSMGQTDGRSVVTAYCVSSVTYEKKLLYGMRGPTFVRKRCVLRCRSELSLSVERTESGVLCGVICTPIQPGV